MTKPIDPGMAHSLRFRLVSTRYPRRVWEAYDGDLAAAASATDAEVASKVSAWERANGLEVRDWIRVGKQERDELDADEGWETLAESVDGDTYWTYVIAGGQREFRDWRIAPCFGCSKRHRSPEDIRPIGPVTGAITNPFEYINRMRPS